MKKLLFFVILIAGASFYSCKCCKTTQKTQDTLQTQVVPFNDNTIKENPVRFFISFISRGEGPNATIKQNIDDYIAKYETEKNKKIAFDKYPWGREGEVDYCFELKELTSSEQAAFIAGAKKIIGESVTVFTYENQVCKHKR